MSNEIQLNPVVIIPTFWSGRRKSVSAERVLPFDYATPISREGTLTQCLEALAAANNIGRIVLLVAATPGIENQAYEKVMNIASRFPALNLVVIGQAQLNHFNLKLEALGVAHASSCINLNSEGGVRNLGLAVASIFEHDTAIFLDERHLARRDFLEHALFGIGAIDPNGVPIAAKTGYYMSPEGNFTSPEAAVPWYRRFWTAATQFNQYMQAAVKGPRLSPAKNACNGCMVLHAEAFGHVPFDPWIARGEDLDYLLSGQMYGQQMWFDNAWQVTSLPERYAKNELEQFKKDVQRWFYENRKIEFAKTQIDLLQLNRSALEPYPAPWITKKIDWKARITAYLSALGSRRQFFDYARAGRTTRHEAAKAAKNNCSLYFEFQRQWPQLIRALWNDRALAAQFTNARGAGSVGSPSFTGRFAAVNTGIGGGEE